MDRTASYSDVIRFHGHECPGAAFGVRVAQAAVARLGRHSKANELVAVSETDACAVDAIQVLTGCTFGKRNLLHRDHGRNAFSFWRREDARGIRIRARPGGLVFRTPEISRLAEKMEDRAATAEEANRFAFLQAERTGRILAVSDEELLTVEEIAGGVPARKPVRAFVPCDQCGEPTGIGHLDKHRGRLLCPPCHRAAHGDTADQPTGHHHQH